MDSADLSTMPRLRLTPEDGRRTPVQHGHVSAKLFAYGSMELRWYAPQHLPGGVDTQVPHDRDELYVIVSGTAVFVRAEDRAPFGDDTALSLLGEERVTVQPGDTLFVPSGTEHRFEAASADFGCWMIFYGPEGGEQP